MVRKIPPVDTQKVIDSAVKKARGRPRKSPVPTPKKTRGRPRIHPLPPRRQRGRPRRNPISPPRETPKTASKIETGRPRKDDVNKSDFLSNCRFSLPGIQTFFRWFPESYVVSQFYKEGEKFNTQQQIIEKIDQLKKEKDIPKNVQLLMKNFYKQCNPKFIDQFLSQMAQDAYLWN